MLKIYLTSTTMQPHSQRVYLHTRFMRPSSENQFNNQQMILGQIYFMDSTSSYTAKLKRKNINQQLTFNNELLNRLEAILDGKKCIIVHIQKKQYNQKYIVVSTQIQVNLIRVTLFQTQITQYTVSPYMLMRSLLVQLTEGKQLTLACLKAKQEKQREKLAQIALRKNQLVEHYRYQNNIIQQRFINVLNETKKQLSKYFGLNQNHNEQINEQQKMKMEKLLKQKQKQKNKKAQEHKQNIIQIDKIPATNSQNVNMQDLFN